MKKISFPLIVTLLVCIILTLIGYNTLITRNESKKYQNLQQKEQDQQKTTSSQHNGPTIYCIGDSLTLDSHSYPTILSELTNCSIETFGGSKDQTIDIAIRTGRTKIYTNHITIPAQSSTPIEITLYNEDHEKLDVLKNKGSNFSNVEINGISGILKYDSENKTHTFTRDESGEEVVINKYTQILADFPSFDKNGIAIIFTGTYDPYQSGSIFRTITYQRAILNQLGVKKYIVVSLTSKRTFSIVKDMNSVLEEEHGEHFLDFRSYLLENGLKDAKITPTSQDQDDLDKGYIPHSLLQDNLIDGNADFHELLAKQLVQKMKDLKYINDDDLKDENE